MDIHLINATQGNRIAKSLQFRTNQCGAADPRITENPVIDKLSAIADNLLFQGLDLAINRAVFGLL